MLLDKHKCIPSKSTPGISESICCNRLYIIFDVVLCCDQTDIEIASVVIQRQTHIFPKPPVSQCERRHNVLQMVFIYYDGKFRYGFV